MVQALSSYSYVGIFFGVAVAICLYAGYWLDGRLGTKPWFTLGGVILGVATGFVELYRVSKKALREHDT
jgi:F0F1-type ATP synthase assembly protein I